MNILLENFNEQTQVAMTEKEALVDKLLSLGHITTREAVILLKTFEIKMEMSSGAMIVNGNYTEDKKY